MNYDFYGRVVSLGTIESGQGARGEWKSQDVVFEHEVGQYPRHVVVRLWGDNLARYQFVVNQFYHIVCRIDARENAGRWFNSISLVSAEMIDQQTCYNNQMGNRMGVPSQPGFQQPAMGGYQQPQMYGQPQPAMSGFQQPQMGGFQQPAMGGFQQPQMGGMPQQVTPPPFGQMPQQPVQQPAAMPGNVPPAGDFMPPMGTPTNTGAADAQPDAGADNLPF